MRRLHKYSSLCHSSSPTRRRRQPYVDNIHGDTPLNVAECKGGALGEITAEIWSLLMWVKGGTNLDPEDRKGMLVLLHQLRPRIWRSN